MNKKYSFLIFLIIFALFAGLLFLWNKNIPDGQISAVIVPHHDLVKEKREAFFSELSKKIKSETVIIASPNHFFTGSSDVITTDKTWILKDSTVEADKDKINQILAKNEVSNDEIAFSREHGITNLLQEIKDNFPKAKIIPLIFKDNTPKEKIDQIADNLNTICQKNCLLIASVDFSHYLPGALAEIHDASSIRALNNLDEDLIWQAEVDSNQSLALAIKWAKFQKTEKFNLIENTNSGKISKERDAETTSYVLGYFEKGIRQSAKADTAFMISNNLVKNPEIIGERFFRGVDKKFEDENWVNDGLFSPFKPRNDRLFETLASEIKQGSLVVAGDVDNDNLKLVLLPIKNISNAPELLRGEEKTEVIKRIRRKTDFEISNYGYGYDIIELNK